MSSGEAGREDRIGLDFAIVEDPWGSSAGKESPEDLSSSRSYMCRSFSRDSGRRSAYSLNSSISVPHE